MRFPTMWYVRLAKPQSDQSLCMLFENSMIVKLLTEHHHDLGASKLNMRLQRFGESTHFKMPHCWKSHALAHVIFKVLFNF